MAHPQCISYAIYDLTSNAERIFLSYPFSLLSAGTLNKVIKLSRIFFFGVVFYFIETSVLPFRHKLRMELKHVKHFVVSQRKLPHVYHLNKPSLTMFVY